MLASLRAEFIKMRRLWLPAIAVAGGLLVALLVWLSLSSAAERVTSEEKLEVPWQTGVIGDVSVTMTLVLPGLAILVTALCFFVEHRNDMWKQLRATPQPPLALYAAKFAVIQLLMALALTTAFVATLCGWPLIPGPLQYELTGSVTDAAGRLAGIAALLYLSLLPIGIAQFLLSAKLPNILHPVGIGLAATFACLMATGPGKAAWLPYAYPGATIMYRFAQDRFSREDGTEVATKLAATLERAYVYPDLGTAYATALRHGAQRGAYGEIDSPEALASALTADLQRVHPDLHLKVFLLHGGRDLGRPRNDNISARWAAPGVALIGFDEFLGSDADLGLLGSLLDRYAAARSLVFDLRNNSGGGLKETDVIFSRIFSREEPLIESESRVSAERRHPSPFAALPTMRQVSAPEGMVRRRHFAVPAPEATPLRQARVFVLISRRTASAAEHMAYALKLTHRATLVGERTAGAGHFGDVAVLGHGLGAFIPMGRGYDPVSGKGWEGVGVQPDVPVPAAKALEVAVRRASAG